MTQYRSFCGLTDDEVLSSASEHGYNVITQKKRRSFFRQFLSSFNDPIIKILLVTLFINALFWIRDFDPYEACGIIIAILLSTLISSISEYGSEGAFLSLLQESERCTCSVIRNGEIRVLPPCRLVCGDLVILIPGEKIHADGVIISGKVSVNQSSLNGESKQVSKYPSKKTNVSDISCCNTLLCGTVICDGEGVMRIEKVGDDTVYGKIAGELQEESGASPLKKKLSILARTISKLGFISAFLVAFADIFNTAVIDNGFDSRMILAFFSQPQQVLQAAVHALTLALTVIIVAVPEGLPMMIGVVLSANIKRMKRDKVLVRKPVGIETAGGINILFTDKTGTLTYGQMTVSEFILANGKTVSAKEFRKSALWQDFCLCSVLNTSCKKTATGITDGNSTDKALYLFADGQYAKNWHTASFTPFTSDRKFSMCKIENGIKKRTFIKGAFEILFGKCSCGVDENGKRTVIDPEFSKAVHTQASSGGRIIIIAYSDNEDGRYTLLCATVLRDELRKEAACAVSRLQNAGVDVVMITGDSADTASAIAKKANIITKKRTLTVTGAELEKMTDEQVKKILPGIACVARAYPSDKSRLVRLCSEDGKITAMTGDGINDSPALKKAHVGFSLGSGTSVAKEASDIVITDDNISSVSKAVLYGRTIFKSIRKFLLFQLTMNFCAVAVSLFAPLIGCQTPVTVLQMLWINIIMDTLAGLAFAGEAPRDEYMKLPPTDSSEPVLSRDMMKNIVCTGVFCTALMLWYLTSDFVCGVFGGRNTEFYCGFFGLFVFMGIFNCLNARTHKINLFSHITENKYFCFIILAITAVQLLLMYFGGSVFRCAPLHISRLIFVILLASLVIPINTVYKIILREKRRKTV